MFCRKDNFHIYSYLYSNSDFWKSIFFYFCTFPDLSLRIKLEKLPESYKFKYPNNEKFLSAAIYNRVKRVRTIVRPSPLQSVRRTFFSYRTVVILHPEPSRPQEPSRSTSETIGRNFLLRIFPIARWERGVPLSDKLRFVRQRSSLCEAGAAPESRPFFKLYMDTNRKRTQQSRTLSYKHSFRLNEEQHPSFHAANT